MGQLLNGDNLSAAYFEVPPCFVTTLMKGGIQRHRVEVQGRIFASEMMVSGSVTATPTHPRSNPLIKLDCSGGRMLTKTGDRVRLPLQSHQEAGVAMTSNSAIFLRRPGSYSAVVFLSRARAEMF